MTPKPAPKTQRPVRNDPKVGQYQAVISFRCRPLLLSPHELRDQLEAMIEATMNDLAGLCVTVYEITAPSEHEGTVGPLAQDETHPYEYDGGEDGHCRRCGGWPNDPRHEGTVGLDVTEDAEYGRAQDDVPVKDGRL